MPVAPRSSRVTQAWWRLTRGAVVTLAVLVAAGCSQDDGLDDVAPTTTSAPSTTSTTTTSTTTSTTTTTTTTTTTVPPVPLDLELEKGDSGDAVWELEQQLLAAGYWLPKTDDGVFDDHTMHAVTAVQKVHGLPRTGVADLATLAALSAPPPTPRSTGGLVIEVDLARQVTFVVRDGVVTEIFDVSTGKRKGSTPVGEHTITREIDGIRNAPLGRLYRPKYIVGGVAFHGYPSVPPEPASHGCIRMTNAVMDHVWETGLMPKGTPVLVY
ncbi:MAG TPA: L,D-transpeptidase family protein [Acidimicrobiales bacterium]